MKDVSPVCKDCWWVAGCVLGCLQILDVDSGAEHQDFMLDKGMEYEYGQYIVCHSVVTIGPKTSLQKVKCHHLREEGRICMLICKCATQASPVSRICRRIDVPSIPLGRGFVTRGLESYESSEDSMHPWVIDRTWTRSCKR